MKYAVRETQYRKRTVYEVCLSFKDNNSERVIARYTFEDNANEVAETLNDNLLYEVE